MANKKSLKILGYLMMLLGVTLPLYAFSNLALDGIENQRAYAEYVSSRQEMNGEEARLKREQMIKQYQQQTSGDAKTYVDPFGSNDFKMQYTDWQDETVFGYLRVPSLDIAKPIRLGASYGHLSEGVAQVYGTDLPVGGVGTRSVIAGHRGWFTDAMFIQLGEMAAGDMVYVELPDKVLSYQVQDVEIIRASEPDKLAPVADKDMLTLLTCDPITPLATMDRLLVNCKRVGTLPADAFAMKASVDKVAPTANGEQTGATAIDTQPVKKSVAWIRYGIDGVTIFLALLWLGVFWRMLGVIRR